MFQVLRRLADWFTRGYVSPPMTMTAAKEEDDELEWLRPPSSTSDPEAWDRYWNDQVTHGLTPPLYDMFCDDTELVGFMARHGLTRVLCAGSGISQEPRILAEAGLRVVALDISPTALRLAQAWSPRPGESAHIVEPTLLRPGGSVEYVVGSMLDASLCPGPFDLVIERRTLQIFAPEERGRALEALAARLTERGVFLSHCHDGAWRPPARPFHATESLFRGAGWPILRHAPLGDLERRSAWLVGSTG